MRQGRIENFQNSLTSEERIERARAAGIASGEARRKAKIMRDTLTNLMTLPVPDTEIAGMLEASGIQNSIENAIAFSALIKAAKGDIEAARFCRDTLGQKPTESFNLSMAQKERPISSLDLRHLTDEELIALADQCEDFYPTALEAHIDD